MSDRYPPALCRPFTRETARRAGVTGHELERGLRDGTLVRLRRGVLVVGDAYAALDDRGRHAWRAGAHLAALKPPAAASHGTAALLFGLPVLWPVHRVEVTSPVATPSARADIVLRKGPLPEHHRGSVDGIAVTTIARTVVDCARTRPLGQAMVVADAALHRGLLTREQLAALVRGTAGWPGAPRARRVAGAAQPAESPGETLLRLDLAALGVLDVQVQAVLAGHSGRCYRVDLLIVRLGVIAEFDGAVKYGGLDGRPGTDALLAEKDREDDLRLAGWGVLRARWAELGNLERLRRKLDAACGQSRRGLRTAG